MDYVSRITVDPEVRFGKPCVRGTRMTVGDVLSYLASGMSEEEILKDFPQLTRDDPGYELSSPPIDRGLQHYAGARISFATASELRGCAG